MNKLAIDGGERTCLQSLPFWPHYGEDEIAAVTELLRSGHVNQWTGPDVGQFEEKCANFFNQPHAVALANGTLALELALIAAGIGAGDEVIVTPRSFIASASCVILRGATPVFADVDLQSQNITAATISAVISPRTKAIIPVHLNGYPCDMQEIMKLAKQHNLYVIEDCAQAHGATLNGQPVGSFGNAAAFSFCQDKIISTGGEGGMVLFADEDDWRLAWGYKDHGKSQKTVFQQPTETGFRWLHESFGSNWRMTNIQAAIGLKQLDKLPNWHKRRSAIAQQLSACLDPYAAVSIPLPGKNMSHAWYRFSFVINEEKLARGWSRNKLMNAIKAEGLNCLEVCPEIYREQAFKQLKMPHPKCPNAITLGQTVLQIPIHPMLDETAMKCICQALEKVFDIAS